MRLLLTTILMAMLGTGLTCSAAEPDATLTGTNFWVDICKDPTSDEYCDDARQLVEDVGFGLHRNPTNDFYLAVTYKNPKIRLEIPVTDVTLSKEGPPTPPTAKFCFKDFKEQGDIVTKAMELRLIQTGGNSTTNVSCEDELAKHTGTKFTNSERATQCQEQSVIHWIINARTQCPYSEDNPPMVHTLTPPGDGQGTGSDTPPH